MSTIASIIKAGITAGKTNEEILVEVYKAFPNANTKSASVAWYRSQMKKAGDVKPPKVKPSTKTVKAAVPPPSAGDEAFAKVMEKLTEPPHYDPKGYRVKKVVRVVGGLEGDGFQATLYRGEARIALVTDQGNGGCLHWQWLGSPAKATVKTRDYKGDPYEYEGNVEEALLAAHCMTLPDVPCPFADGGPLQMCPELFIEELVNNETLAKQFRHFIKGKIAYLNEKGQLYTLKKDPTPEVLELFVAGAKGKYTLLNTMTEEEGVACLKKLQR